MKTASVICGASARTSASTSSSPPSGTFVFRDLEADDFRHPLDQQVATLSKRIYHKFNFFLFEIFFAQNVWISCNLRLFQKKFLPNAEYIAVEGHSWAERI